MGREKLFKTLNKVKVSSMQLKVHKCHSEMIGIYSMYTKKKMTKAVANKKDIAR